MSIGTPCVGTQPQQTELCDPMCVRWSEINQGMPLKVFHDKSQWDPNHYPLISEPDPDVYLIKAIDLWNSGYPCGDLFELTDDLSEALVTMEYVQQPVGDCAAVATTLCFCDAESEICERVFDHSSFYSVDRKQPITMNLLNGCPNQDALREERWNNTMVHELGHVLGMGHVFNQSFPSVMGNRNNDIMVLYGHDLDMIARRHPCNCIMVNPLSNTEPLTEAHLSHSGEHCPGCAY